MGGGTHQELLIKIGTSAQNIAVKIKQKETASGVRKTALKIGCLDFIFVITEVI